MSTSSKRYRANQKKVEAQKRYEPAEAFALLKSMAPAKFDESVDIAVRLGVDAKKSDQMVRTVVKLPHGTGRKVRVLVFARGEKEQQARDAGADFVGGDDLVQKIQAGFLDFDTAIATPDMMPKVAQVAKILGPRKLMPSPKTGTVTTDPARVVAEEKAGRVEVRVEKAGIVHAPIGKLSFSAEHLQANFMAVMEQVVRHKPDKAKGVYLKAIDVSSTMGPGIGIDPNKAAPTAIKE